MISLARHIELLLLEHDCVIVPGLGGFIANHAEARYNGEEEELFLPPYRTIGFNQQLQINDGLLVQSYMMAYDTSYPFASLQMEKDLEKMMTELDMTGEYVLENIGTLKKGINQHITFTAPETGALTPSLYGLYSYELQPLQQVIKRKEIEKNLQAASALTLTTQEEKAQPKSKRRDIVIRINRHWLDFGISVAAAVVLFFCFSYPAIKDANNETDTVVATFTPLGDATPKPKVAARPHALPHGTATTTDTSIKPKANTEKSETATASKPAAPVAPSPPSSSTQKSNQQEPKYAIVLASFVNQQNAENLVKELAKEGFPEGRYAKTGKTSRILYSGFEDEAAAQAALNTLRQQNKAFNEAWILALQE